MSNMSFAEIIIENSDKNNLQSNGDILNSIMNTLSTITIIKNKTYTECFNIFMLDNLLNV